MEATSLKSVFLDFNPISGILPNAESLKNLTNLSISNTMISGTIPNELGLLTHLERISLNRNPTLFGTLPLSLTFLSNLKIMDLSFVDLSGTIPESIGNMISLRECLNLWDLSFLLQMTQSIVP
jgi:Leucine-rich repeat (LRR) protein